jgi:Flp pilus assembly protein TadG
MAFGGKMAAIATWRRFGFDARGGVAIIFAFSLPMLTIALGGAVDLSRAYAARQTLSEVATLACQYASRPSVVGSGDFANSISAAGQAAYRKRVTDFIGKTLSTQNFQYPQTTLEPFTFVPHGPADIRLTATVPTSFMAIAQIATVPVAAAVHCFDQPLAGEEGRGMLALATEGATMDPAYREQLAQRQGLLQAIRFCNSPRGSMQVPVTMQLLSEDQLRALCPPR